MRRALLRMAMCLTALAGMFSTTAQAADHRDGNAVFADHSTDVNDVYAWMSSDKAKLYLAMTVFPAADTNSKFSNAAKYVFHLQSSASYGASPQNVNVVCTFDAGQKISCWTVAGATTLDYVTGDASAAAGIASASGKMKVFAGLRSDPFYFNLDGFKKTAMLVGMAAPALVSGNKFDAAGCPMLDSATASSLVSQLAKAPDGSAPVDFFKPLNGLAIVLAVDAAMVTPGGKILGVWGSTNK